MFAKMLQDYVTQVRETTGIHIGIADETGNILASADEARFEKTYPFLKEFIGSETKEAVYSGISFQKVFNRNKVDYVVLADFQSEESSKLLSIISINILGMKAGYDEKYDKNIFIKNIMLDELVHGDIAARAKELHVSYSVPRVVFIIKTSGVKDTYVHEVVQGIFPNRSKDFILIPDKEQIVLIKELKSNTDYREVEKTANIIADTLSTELMVKAYVGIGTIAENVVDIGRSYREAQISLLVGKIFLEDRYIFSYNSLGLGRLIYQLPEANCKLFLDEFFKGDNFDFMDSETMLTIQKFFENSLNISETSRQLFVHRNTLVYRLDKIQKLTGLDLRKFDDAITFKIALMVKKYLDRDERI
ncbi:MAG: helix-turn-helix domain-containing protein [Clostridia bacterium]|nr:helix-turn-helix domain-containing protein [Clostridia bacterium]